MNIGEIRDAVVGNSSFSLIDYTVVGISLAVILFYGMYHGLLSPTNREDFLVGGRSMSAAPVAVSTAMLYISALAIIERPADIYYHGVQSFMFTIVMVAVVPLGAFLFVSMFYNMQLTSVYQYVGHRFDSTALRLMTSCAFIAHATLYSCIVLGSVSYALERYFQVPLMTSIIGIGVFAAVNTTMGGFKATVWTQVFCYLWTVLFLLALAIVSASKAGGFLHAFELTAQHGRLELFNLQIDPFVQHNLLNFVVGYGFITLMEMATCQHIVQRYSSLRSSRDSIKSILMSIPLNIFPSILCLFIGIFLQASYAGCDPMTIGQIAKPQDIIPHFIRKTLSFIPGMIGIFAASIVGCAISIHSTVINSVTACIYQDFIRKIACGKSKPNTKLSDSASCCRLISLFYAAVPCVIALLALKFSSIETILPLVSTSNLIMFNAILYGPLAAVYLMGLFCPCINKYGTFIGFLGGVACTGYTAFHKISASSTTPFSTLLPIMGDCPDARGLNGTLLARFLPLHPKNETVPEALELSWSMDDFMSVSYLLLTIFGAIVTIIISFPISVLTGGLCLCASRKVPANLLHPALSISGCCVDTEQRDLEHAISHRYVDRISSLHNLFPGSGAKLNSKPPSYKYSSIPETPTSE